MKICKVYFYLFMFLSLNTFLMGLYFYMLDYSLIAEINLLSVISMKLVYPILLDWMSLLFLSFVLFISSMVIYYSEEYMAGDYFLDRFILLVVMFVLSMIMLIISPNIVSILLGWDGLGLVSYCLVIYYQNIKSYNAGMLTALSNRIGDVMLLMSIAWMMNYGSWNYVMYLDFYKNEFESGIISFLIIVAAMTKSAQIPFSSWLPAAMAAPTPVSSLVHSSTLVTAGVYLLIRFNFLFSYKSMFFMLFISSMTMFMSGLGAVFEFDLKKIIALSTLSQLGLMMVILSMGEYKLAFFHLLIHALFKALLFMCAGNIIHSVGGSQDIRYMGAMINQLPLTCSFLNICNLSLCGLPFLSGFYSKDLIAEFMSMSVMSSFVYMIFYMSVGLTVCYSFRLSYYSMVSYFQLFSLNYLLEKSEIMLMGMGGLIFIVIFSGSTMMWVMFLSPYFICLSIIMKMMTVLFIIMGAMMGVELSKLKISFNNKSLELLKVSKFLGSMWNMPLVSTLGVSWYPIYTGNSFKLLNDYGWFEYYGGFNLKLMFMILSKNFQILFLNHIKIYFLMMVIWLLILFMII
uniref:NADH-ubiquinone oxidoreductase chain 5 n=1 Tax=Aulacochilus grouvellei TaxID=2800504 RepID=A0A7T6YAS4_9CUCU|nr:NADH dehydrogenase subunit 5 [Aulacochilus grouvellei]QQK56319.1 NADH dehydrogenase subunit 5 [Aulacochilus grouvellei]